MAQWYAEYLHLIDEIKHYYELNEVSDLQKIGMIARYRKNKEASVNKMLMNIID